MALQEQMIAMPDELKIDPPVTHHFAPGQYARQMDIPAGTVIIGKIHKHAHVNVISKGTGYVATEFGKQAYAAPMTFISEPGTKRAVYAETDTVWTTVHVTNETDLVKIEDEIIAPSYDALLRLA
jgi:quercetin dioxygenase-like cupin family protein